jgi:hypothetical protein
MAELKYAMRAQEFFRLHGEFLLHWDEGGFNNVASHFRPINPPAPEGGPTNGL